MGAIPHAEGQAWLRHFYPHKRQHCSLCCPFVTPNKYAVIRYSTLYRAELDAAHSQRPEETCYGNSGVAKTAVVVNVRSQVLPREVVRSGFVVRMQLLLDAMAAQKLAYLITSH